jgi:hypothetical protein
MAQQAAQDLQRLVVVAARAEQQVIMVEIQQHQATADSTVVAQVQVQHRKQMILFRTTEQVAVFELSGATDVHIQATRHKYNMRIVEILLPKNTRDRDLSPKAVRQIDSLQRRMDSYVDKILDPNTSAAGREFLKSRLRDDYYELKGLLPHIHHIAEAVHKLPLSDEDFDLVKELMGKPIPAAIAPIYISEVINDDELNDQLKALEDSQPGLDVRPIIAEWFNRVMPDQMYRFKDNEDDTTLTKGLLSPIHGYDPHMYKGTNDPITGDAYGRF